MVCNTYYIIIRMYLCTVYQMVKCSRDRAFDLSVCMCVHVHVMWLFLHGSTIHTLNICEFSWPQFLRVTIVSPVLFQHHQRQWVYMQLPLLVTCQRSWSVRQGLYLSPSLSSFYEDWTKPASYGGLLHCMLHLYQPIILQHLHGPLKVQNLPTEVAQWGLPGMWAKNTAGFH